MADFSIPPELPEIIKSLTREVLRAQPDDIIQFCATYFSQQLSAQHKQYRAAGNKAAPDSDPSSSRPMSSSVESSSRHITVPPEEELYRAPSDDDFPHDDDEEEDLAPLPPPTIPHNRGRRTSVSAESMAPTADANYEKVVIPKSDEQRERIKRSIGNNFLFKNLDEEQYRDVVDAMAEKQVRTGESIIKQGGVGDYFYVVETGAFDVFVSRNGTEAKVTDYGPGGSFGELALMYNAPRAATVTATTDSVLWALDRVTFRRILMDHTSRKRRMYENFLEEVPLLVGLEPYERHKIADALESVTFEDGQVVFKQGDAGEGFYIIESGNAAVIKTDEAGVSHQMKGLQKGDYFGELALLSDKPRAATIVAQGRLKCATLGKKAFTRLLGPLATIMQRHTAQYEGYSMDTINKMKA
ncbi:hypothetical protein RI367_008285 [Sorochytrium milnesiophthora]